VVRIAIVQLPHLANFTDCDPLFLEPGVCAYFCRRPEELQRPKVVILQERRTPLVACAGSARSVGCRYCELTYHTDEEAEIRLARQGRLVAGTASVNCGRRLPCGHLRRVPDARTGGT
jgi:hypothetical protein